MSLRSNGRTLDREIVLSDASTQEDEEPNPDSYLVTAYVGYFERSGARANSPILEQETFISPQSEWGPNGEFGKKEDRAQKAVLANLRKTLVREDFTRAEIREAFAHVLREYP